MENTCEATREPARLALLEIFPAANMLPGVAGFTVGGTKNPLEGGWKAKARQEYWSHRDSLDLHPSENTLPKVQGCAFPTSPFMFIPRNHVELTLDTYFPAGKQGTGGEGALL